MNNKITNINFFPRQFSQIKEEGWRTLIRKLHVGVRYGITLPIYLLAVPIVLIVRSIRPLIWLRFGPIRSDVIGNSAFNVEYYLSERELEKTNSIDLFYFSTLNLCNEQWGLMVRRHLHVHPLVRYLDQINQLLPGGQTHILRMSEKGGMPYGKLFDTKGVFYYTEPHTPFTKDENKRGRNFLQEIGMKREERFVCLLVRDSAYKSKYQNWNKKRDWSYHNYRDSDIELFKDAVSTLAEKGYWVIRMGKAEHKPIGYDHTRVLDYANTSYRSDFLDIWLMANCHFCITTGAGLDDVCVAFRRPLVEVNYLPLAYNGFSKGFTINLFRYLRWKSDEKFLRLDDLIKTGAIGFLATRFYEDLGVEIVDNTSQEIADAVIEMEGRLDGTWVETDEDIELQTVFWEKFKTIPGFADTFGWKHPESRISSSFLRKNHDWFLK